MIEVNTRIHDKFSIEFKTSFVARRKVKDNDFSAYMWFFIPHNLDINRETYPKSRFYQDIKSYVRVITPKFLLQDIVGGSGIPFTNLKAAFQDLASSPTRSATKEYEYQVKMFSAITHSAARNGCYNLMGSHILPEVVPTLCAQYLQAFDEVLRAFRSLRTIVYQPTIADGIRNYFRYGDEFISNMFKLYTTLILDFMQKDAEHRELFAASIKRLQTEISRENAYRDKVGYVNLKENDAKNNRYLIYRSGVLKKYVDSDLYLNVPKKKDGKLVEQLYLGIAAGLAMMFATVVSFFFQQKFGNFTLPFFIVLVISYMIKDRIKELSRYYFAHRIGNKYFDNKAEILLNEDRIGTIKEGMDFITHKKVPEEVKRVRYSKRLMEVENRVTDEKVMLYRMALHIDRGETQQPLALRNRRHQRHYSLQREQPIAEDGQPESEHSPHERRWHGGDHSMRQNLLCEYRAPIPLREQHHVAPLPRDAYSQRHRINQRSGNRLNRILDISKTRIIEISKYRIIASLPR